MAKPMTAAKFLSVLKAEGLTVHEVGDWRTHTRGSGPGSSRPWGPEVYGVVVHHTVTSSRDGSVALCRDGYSGLPGPLCHGVIDKAGHVWLVGYGRTNHAGGGDGDVLAAVRAQTYAVRPPVPNVGNADGVDGNRHFYGFECINLGNGKDPWPDAQLLAIEKASAAICRYHGWKPQAVIGHLEWSDDKSDPRGFTMASMRARVKTRLAPPKKYHTVVDGDTLWAIAERYKTTVVKLRSLNPKVKDDVIVPGDPDTGKIRYV